MKPHLFTALLKSIVLMACLFALSVQAQTPAPAHDFARWEKDIAAFEEKDKTTPPPQNAIVFTGSSTILLWRTMAEDLPGYKVVNRGFGGSEIVDATYYADRIIIPLNPKMVLIRSGGNDIFRGNSPEKVFADFKAFVTKIHGKLPKTEIVYIALSPSVARWEQADKERALNAMVKDFVKTAKLVKYLDDSEISLGADGKPRPELFISDKLHFNADGYKLFSAKVREYLAKTK